MIGNKKSPMGMEAPSTDAVNRIVEGTTFEGNIRSQSNMRVDGTFEGDIATKGRLVGVSRRDEVVWREDRTAEFAMVHRTCNRPHDVGVPFGFNISSPLFGYWRRSRTPAIGDGVLNFFFFVEEAIRHRTFQPGSMRLARERQSR